LDLSVGDYVIIHNLPYTYIIIDIKSDNYNNGDNIILYNLSKPFNKYSYEHVDPDRIVKKKKLFKYYKIKNNISNSRLYSKTNK
jgi:hypothetical protein